MVSTLADCVEALTVTGRRLAEMTKARGFFQAHDKKGDSKGKSKGKGKNSPFQVHRKGSLKGRVVENPVRLLPKPI